MQRIIVMILLLIASCSSANHLPELLLENQAQASDTVLEKPYIPFDIKKAFLPFRKNAKGEILPSYTYKICTKKLLGICRKWEIQTVYPSLEWLYLNDFGACQRPRPTTLR